MSGSYRIIKSYKFLPALMPSHIRVRQYKLFNTWVKLESISFDLSIWLIPIRISFNMIELPLRTNINETPGVVRIMGEN